MSRIAPEALIFQSPIVQVQEEPLPWLLRLWPVGTAALLLTLVLLTAVVPVDVVVTARGRIVTDDPPAVLKPVGPAMLRSLPVRAGDAVQRGQLVARLDPRDPETSVAVLQTRQVTLTAEIARIEAEIAGRAVTGETPALALQARVQDERAAGEAAQRDGLVAELSRIDNAIAAETVEGPQLAEWTTTARELETMRHELLGRQNGTRVAYIEARIARMSAEERMRQHEARLVSLARERESAVARLAAFDSDLRETRLEDLARLRPELAMIEDQLSNATGLARMYDLVAPVDGVVLSVAEGGPGSLMTMAESVAVIAPSGSPIHAEIGLRSSDIGLVQPGAETRIKVDAFPWRRHGIIQGQLSDIAPSSATTPASGGEALHAARVAFEPGTPVPEGLMPGMTLTTDITTGTRSMLEFFLDPLLNGLKESLREPSS